jgi:hypothetical protein
MNGKSGGTPLLLFQGRDFRLTDVAGNVVQDWIA